MTRASTKAQTKASKDAKPTRPSRKRKPVEESGTPVVVVVLRRSLPPGGGGSGPVVRTTDSARPSAARYARGRHPGMPDISEEAAADLPPSTTVKPQIPIANGGSDGDFPLLPLPPWLPSAPVNEDDLRCPKCDIVYYSKLSIKNHIQVCKANRRIPPKPAAPSRPRTSRGTKKLNEEEKSSLKILEASCFASDEPTRPDDDDKHFLCEECDDLIVLGSMAFARHLFAHTLLRVDEQETPAMCGFCGFDLEHMRQLKEHLGRSKCPNGTPGKPMQKCRICGLPFTRKEGLRKHLRLHASSAAAEEGTSRRRFECVKCPRRFGCSSLLSTHSLSHKKPRRKLRACKKCGKTYVSGKNLEKHLKSCGEDELRCRSCAKAFGDGASLLAHEKTHDGSGRPPHRCRWCTSAFFTRAELQAHGWLHDDKLFHVARCKPCKRTFTNSHNLKIHLWHTHQMSMLDNEACDEDVVSAGMYDFMNVPSSFLKANSSLPNDLSSPPLQTLVKQEAISSDE